MERWLNRVALVTGASTGIGADFCRCLVKHGVTVVGCARRLDRLQELKKEVENEKGSLVPYQCDVSKSQEIVDMFAFIKENHGGVDICINNAAIVSTHSLLDATIEDLNNLNSVNVVAVAHCTQLSIQNMMERAVTDGCIVNVSSMGAHRMSPLSSLHFYSASKIATQTITEGFRRELRELKSTIRISQISPALVQTELYRLSSGWSSAENEQFYSNKPHLTTSHVNDALIYILSTPPSVEVHDLLIRATNQTL